ncbi:Protocadherin Fat 4 [Mactra antiquata]
MRSTQILHAVGAICVLLCVIQVSLCALVYKIPEEQHVGTLIDNIASAANFSSEPCKDGPNVYVPSFQLLVSDAASYFSVGSSSSELRIRRVIDRENGCLSGSILYLSIKAECGPNVVFVDVQVEIEDINDNAPYFPDSVMNVALSENSIIGTSFPVDPAVDADSGQNGAITYSLWSSSDYFHLSTTRDRLGVHLVAKLDYEAVPNHLLTIIATDGGTPSLIGRIFINITVTDVNDEAPRFDQPVYKVHINKDLPVGSIFYIVRAIDDDPGSGGQVSYNLSLAQPQYYRDTFAIDANTGELSLVKTLQNATVSKVDLRIQASDNDPFVRYSSTAVVMVTIEDPHGHVIG